MFAQLESTLLTYIDTVPLEVFVFIASIIEEIIAPIPSPTVMMLAGSFAQIQERALIALIPLAIIGAVGKTLGALVVYGVADKAENVLLGTLGKFFNVSHDDVESLGKKLGKGIRDYFLLTFLRALPIMPSVIVSVGSGVLKVPLKLFIITTFLGTIIRDGFYLYAGYVGTAVFAKFISGSSTVETYVEILALVSIIGFIIYKKFYSKKVIEVL